MAFNILCLTRDPQIEAKFALHLDGLALELVCVEAGDFRQNALSYLDEYRPHCILHFLPPNHVLDAQYIQDTARLNDYSQEHKIHFVQLSSFLIFGNKSLNYAFGETDEACDDTCQAQYFKKLEAIFNDNNKALILRTSWLLNSSENSVFSRILPVMLGQDKSLAVSDHNFGNPIHIRFLIDSVIAIVRQQLCGAKNMGVYHLCSVDSASEAELADHLVRLINNQYGQSVMLPPIAGAGDSRTILPVNAHLNATKITHGFGVQLPTWRKGFKSVFNAWLVDNHQESQALTQLKESILMSENDKA